MEFNFHGESFEKVLSPCHRSGTLVGVPVAFTQVFVVHSASTHTRLPPWPQAAERGS